MLATLRLLQSTGAINMVSALMPEQIGKMNEGYWTFFSGDMPVRSCIGVVSLPDKDALIEIEVIAGG